MAPRSGSLFTHPGLSPQTANGSSSERENAHLVDSRGQAAPKFQDTLDGQRRRFSRTARRFSAASDDGRCVTVGRRHLARVSESSRPHRRRSRGVAFRGDGKQALLGGADATVRLWDVLRQGTQDVPQTRRFARCGGLFSSADSPSRAVVTGMFAPGRSPMPRSRSLRRSRRKCRWKPRKTSRR